MKKILILCFVTALIMSCQADKNSVKVILKASGEVLEEQRNVSDFNEVIVSGPVDLILRQSSGESCRVESYESILDNLVTEVVDSILYVFLPDSNEVEFFEEYFNKQVPPSRINNNQIRWKNGKRVFNIYLDFKTLRAISLAGDSDLILKGSMKQEKIDIAVIGKSDIKMDMNVNQLNLEVAGVADCDFSGRADDFLFDCAGMGTVDALDLRSQDVNINVAGVGRARVFPAGTLMVNIAGVGRIYYKGDPEEIVVDKAGLGKVKKINE